ncbi:MAG: DUF3467 domain-containing protein [Endomicrobium sp.]|jgi:hypothetical protein|nr:DUF3467 domain-containing protein [Endomicrobium sp.]
MEEKKEAKIEIEIDEQTSNGIYSNLALITHSESEFIIDFIFFQPQNRKAKVRSRIITSPEHVKKMIAALQDNIAKYEAKFGQVKNPSKDLGSTKTEYYN